LVVATALPVSALWEALPGSWRETLRARGQRCLRVDPGVESLLAALPALLAGRDSGEDCVPVDESPAVAAGETPLPLAVRRFRRAGETHDNVARFWGEVSQPRIAGAAGPPVPDPYLAVGAVPSATATFHDMSAERGTVPLVSADPCTGCGACWTACPDSSIAPTALCVESLLRTALDRAAANAPGPPDAGRLQLQRLLPQLAARVEGRIKKEDAGSFAATQVLEAAEWLTGKLELSEDDAVAFAAAVEELSAALCRAPLAVTQTFFHAAKAAGGKAELLALAVNPQSCQGCGGCAEVCPVDAIEIVPQRPELVERLASAWTDWELLPDSPGATVARVAEEIGELPSLLLSRHVFFAVAGGDGAEPGSGERLALRHVTAVLESRGQRQALTRAKELTALGEELQEALGETLRGVVEVQDLAAVAGALAASEGELHDRLRDAGASAAVDESRARALVAAAKDVASLADRCLQGPTGVGRSRFGLVVAGEGLADWAASFPRNPFSVPVALDLAGSGPELASGLLGGLLQRGLDEERSIRLARLQLENPPDLAQRTQELRSLSWRRVLAEQPGAAPALLVIGDPASLLAEGAGGLSRLLASDLPVKVLLLDDGSGEDSAVDPVFLALAHRRAFVLSTSVAHHGHLHEGLLAALAFDGPALIRIHAPSPRRDGFSTERVLERAREAVRCRVQPLLRYDPHAEGVFGTRLSLDGNPDPGETWARDDDGAEMTPAHWALGGARWAAGFGPAAADAPALADWLALPADRRLERAPAVTNARGEVLCVPPDVAALAEERSGGWRTLQELAGVVTPFTGASRARVGEELAEGRPAEPGALDEARRRDAAESDALARSRQAAALTERLLRLAGYAGEGPPGS
jgi:pyruvate-ferredoxin/flavodoxin oxidoreductase